MRMRKGFTLIELLVVIAIIAILAAILFPVFLTARARARTTKCMAHGKQIGQAGMMYMGDYNDRFPGGIKLSPEQLAWLETITWEYSWEGYYNPPAIMGGNAMKHIQMKPYVRNMDIWICPDPNSMYAKRYAYLFRCSWHPRSSDQWNVDTKKYDGFVNGDRGFQAYVKDPVTDIDYYPGRTIAEVQDLDARGETQCGRRYMPSTKKVMWMCYALGRWAANGKVGGAGWPWIWPAYAHEDGSVFVYADGHAAWKRMGMGWAPFGYTTLDFDNKQ